MTKLNKLIFPHRRPGATGVADPDGVSYTEQSPDDAAQRIARKNLNAAPAVLTSQKIILAADFQPDANPDAQPQRDQVAKHKEIFARIATHHSDADFMFCPGDLVDRGRPTDAEIAADVNPRYTLKDVWGDFLNLPIPVQNIFVTSGNHDSDYRSTIDSDKDTLGDFLNVFPRVNYHIILGNCLYVFMGDQYRNTSGRITDETFNWWEKLCLKYSNYNIIVCTHQSLEGTIDADEAGSDDIITESNRFIDAMTRADNPVEIDLWISGHHATFQLTEEDNRFAVAHGGVTFVNCGVHLSLIHI